MSEHTAASPAANNTETDSQETSHDSTPPDRPGSKFRDRILCVLAGLDGEQKRVSGQDIAFQLEAYYEEEVTAGRLYPNLDALVDGGLMKKGQIDDRTNAYELTDAGHDYLIEEVAWMASQIGLDVEDSGAQAQQKWTMKADGGRE